MQNNHEQKLDGEVHLWLYVFSLLMALTASSSLFSEEFVRKTELNS